MNADTTCAAGAPPSPTALAQADDMLQARLRQIRYRLIVLSGKGGVGKSTVAANLALALAQAGHSVGLLDVDVHGPSIPKLLGLENAEVENDATGLRPVCLLPNLKVMSIGFLVENAESAVIWRGPMKYNVIRQFLRDVNWGPLDYLVVDSPPGTGDEPLAVVQLIGQPAAAVVVTTPQDVAVADVRRSISFCRQLSLPVAGLIENMSGFVCPHCGKTTDLFKSGGGEALAHEMNVPFLGRVPLDPTVVLSGDGGKPFVGGSQQNPAAHAFGPIVTAIQAGLSAEKERQPVANKEN
jgi:Mrp family chromosome partitioning ATPase